MKDMDKAVTHEEIEKRAYAIYLRRGGQDGSDVDDWFAAEQELAGERGQEGESFRSAREEQSSPVVRRLVRTEAAGSH